jgi:hypothetical protein
VGKELIEGGIERLIARRRPSRCREAGGGRLCSRRLRARAAPAGRAVASRSSAMTESANPSAIVGGDATAVTWVKCGLNFVVPFVVSNLGLLSGRPPR